MKKKGFLLPIRAGLQVRLAICKGSDMFKSKRFLVSVLGLVLSLVLTSSMSMSVEAGNSSSYPELLNGGVAAMLDMQSDNADQLMDATEKELRQRMPVTELDESNLVMANVQNAVNIRAEADADSEKVGKLYKDCGGHIIERKDGWTKFQSGNVIGWTKDEYLLFGEEALALANEVGKMLAVVDTEALNIREEATLQSYVLGVAAQGEVMEVISEGEDGWVCVNYDGSNGYVLAEYVSIDFKIDAGETLEEIEEREAAEREAKRHVKYGEYATDEDTLFLLAALIHCEARGESYEGQVAVGAVVMNRVRSSAYPDTIYGVIYASGQFTPAMNGKLDKVLESGKINASCIEAAKEALSGVSNVGDLTHFRTVNGREGLVIGNHVFY